MSTRLSAPSGAGKTWAEQCPAERPFVKMEGLRNHFVIVDARARPFRPASEQIVRICDPQVGVGGDELIVIEPPTDLGRQQGAHAFMRIYNVDGREVEACGNAARCVAHLLMEEEGGERVRLETLAGVLACERAGERQVRVAMGRFTLDWERIPTARACDTLHVDVRSGPLRDAVAVSIGNPHAVFFVEDLDAVDIPAFAPAIQNDALFPQQVNVGVAQMLDEARLRLRVYERPGVLTMACGSGACAAAVAARARGFSAAARLTVEMGAGAVTITLEEGDVAVMTGPLSYCFSGYLPI